MVSYAAVNGEEGPCGRSYIASRSYTKRMVNEKDRRAKRDDAEAGLISSVLGGENR